jgi:transcriptional regulator with XRE-family HTH domain
MPSLRRLGAGINLRWSSKKSQAVSDFHDRIVLDLPIRPSRHYLKEVTIRPDGRWRDVSELLASHVMLQHRVVDSIDLDFKALVLAMRLVLFLIVGGVIHFLSVPLPAQYHTAYCLMHVNVIDVSAKLARSIDESRGCAQHVNVIDILENLEYFARRRRERDRMLDNERLYALIGERVRRIRETQTPRMSQEDLAKILELKRTSVTNIESGNQKPTLDTLYLLCERFGLEFRDFMPTLAEVTATEERSVVVGGQAQEVGVKTANLVARLRPVRARR